MPRPEDLRRKSGSAPTQSFEDSNGAVRVRGHAQMKAYAAAKMGVTTP